MTLIQIQIIKCENLDPFLVLCLFWGHAEGFKGDEYTDEYNFFTCYCD